MNLNNMIKKYCLQNAILHRGKASSGAIIGKLLAEKPGLKPKIKELMKEIEKTVSEVYKRNICRFLPVYLCGNKLEKSHDWAHRSTWSWKNYAGITAYQKEPE